MKYSALLGAGACVLLAACGNDPAAPAADDGAARAAETPRLVFVFDDLDESLQASPEAEVRAILHNASTGAVIHDINLSETGGVADFGEMDGQTATVSFVVKESDSVFDAVTFSNVDVGTYEVPAAETDCEQPVSIDVTVDSAASDQADAAAVFAFADEVATQEATDPQTSWTFSGMQGCKSLGQVLAFTLAGGRPDLYGYQTDLELEDGGAYTIAVDTMHAALSVTAGERALEQASLSTYIDGHYAGITDVASADDADPMLHGPFDVEGALVQPGAIALNDDATTQWQRLAPVQDAKDSIDLAFWEVDLSVDAFDAERSAQPYSYTAATPALIASMDLAFSDADTGVTWNWTLYAPAAALEIVAPTMPADIEDLIARDTLGDDLQHFELRTYDALDDYADWFRFTVAEPAPAYARAFSVATPYQAPSDNGGSAGDSSCVLPEISGFCVF